MKKEIARLNWQMWEKILVATGWLFGYGHPTYYDVKHKRNMAYFKYTLGKH